MSTGRRTRVRTLTPSDPDAYQTWRDRLAGGGGGGSNPGTILIGGEGGGAAGQYPSYIVSANDPDTWTEYRMDTNASMVAYSLPTMVYTGSKYLVGGTDGTAAHLYEASAVGTDVFGTDATSRLNDTTSGSFAWRMDSDGAGTVAILNDNGVVEYSTDHGATFSTHALSGASSGTSEVTMRYFPDHPTLNWWCGQYSVGGPGKVWVSQIGTTDWSPTSGTMTGVFRGGIAYDSTNAIMGLAGGTNTVNWTDDNGTTWNQSTSGLSGLTVMGGVASDSNGTWVCTGAQAGNGIYYTTNLTGGSWALADAMSGIVISDLAYDPGYGFVAVGYTSGTATMHVYTSADGITWTEKTITSNYANTSTSNFAYIRVIPAA